MTQKRKYRCLDSVLVRTPTLPIEESYPHIDSLSETVKTAIAIASPSLFARLEHKPAVSDVVEKVARYTKRMATRPTPYGLFSGSSLARLGTETDIARGINTRTHTRLDMEVVLQLAEKLEAMPCIRENLTLYSHTNLLVASNRIWVEGLFGEESSIAIKQHPALLRAFEVARTGSTLASLVALLVREFGFNKERALQICNQLCDLGMLVTAVKLALQGPNPAVEIARLIQSLAGAKDIYQKLESFLAEAESWDQIREKTSDSYLAFVERISGTFGQSLMPCQIDSVHELHGKTLSTAIADEVAAASEIAISLSPVDASLVPYASAFRRRYQYDREIPILELLSPRFGLGSPYQRCYRSLYLSEHQIRDEMLSTLASEALEKQRRAITLTNDQLSILACKDLNTCSAPSSLDLSIGVDSDSRTSIDNGDFRIILSTRTGDIGAGRMMGRFAHILGDEALDHLGSIVEIENQQTTDIIADIGFSPQIPRFSNVTLTPSLRRFSIVSGCCPTKKTINIPLQEIVIGLDYENRFYARWTRTGQVIQARNNGMLGKTLMPTAIQFLNDLTLSRIATLYQFDWGKAEKFPFLPTVIAGKTVLRVAQWRLETLWNACGKNISCDFSVQLHEWMKTWNVPSLIRYAANVHDEGLLLLDLTNKLDLEQLKTLLKRNKGAGLVFEYFDTSRWHSVNDQHYETEFVFSLVKNNALNEVTNHIPVKPLEQLQKGDYLQVPGRNWLYLKLDCSPLMQDELLQQLRSFVGSSEVADAVTRWFFVRYCDSEEHLRVRFLIPEGKLYSCFLPSVLKFAAKLVDDSISSKFSIDTYDREVERYGGKAGIELAEELFCLDSQLVLDLISFENVNRLNRSLIAAVSINAILDSFGLDTGTKVAWLQSYAYKSDKNLASTAYRSLKNQLFGLVSGTSDIDSNYTNLLTTLKLIKPNFAQVASALNFAETKKLLTLPVWRITESIVHMHCNRLLGTDRNQERLARTLLLNTLKAVQARTRT